MTDWKTETNKYLADIERWRLLYEKDPPSTTRIPDLPLENHPTQLQALLHCSISYFRIGCWFRTKEIIGAITNIWSNGYISCASPLCRLLFEIWGSAHYLNKSIAKYKVSNNIEKLTEVVSKTFAGVRSPVLMPWGTLAHDKPIHVLELIRGLEDINPKAIDNYNDLCESSHPNYPRYMELWLVGKYGDNWTNETVIERGHKLLSNVTKFTGMSIDGILIEVKEGLKICDEIY